MGLLSDVYLSKPSFSNSDLQFINTISATPGPLYPVLVKEVLPYDTWDIEVNDSIMTLPLQGPLQSSIKQQIAFFFVPSRLYCQKMDQNYRQFDLQNTLFPTLKIGLFNTSDSTILPDTPINSYNYVVPPSSIADLIGFNAGSCFYVGLQSNCVLKNAIPLIGYYDIFRNWYANSQEGLFYIAGTDVTSKDPVWATQQLDSLDTFVNQFVKNNGYDFATAWSASFNQTTYVTNPLITSGLSDPISGSGTADHVHIPLAGLVLRTHQSDRATAWLSSSTYNNMVTSSNVDTSSGSFTVNQLRFATHLLRYDEHNILAGGRLNGLIQAEYGIRTDSKLCIPELLGVVSSWLGFQEVISPSSTQGDQFSSNAGQIVSVGRSTLNSRSIRFTASENGYLMAIFSMIPNVSYSSGVADLYDKTRYSDLYSPSMDRIGFQSLMFHNISTSPQFGTPGSSRIAPLIKYTEDYAVGYQPAWVEYTTSLNEAHGRLNHLVGDLNYYLLTRHFVVSDNSVSEPPSSATSTNPTSYILPNQFVYPFLDQSEFAENFICQFNFNVKVRRAKSKSVMPTLA